MTRLSNKVAIITGAASGMGSAEARLFAEEGASVVLADVDEAGIATLTEDLLGLGGGHTIARATDDKLEN